jgi:hypothetical protein
MKEGPEHAGPRSNGEQINQRKPKAGAALTEYRLAETYSSKASKAAAARPRKAAGIAIVPQRRTAKPMYWVTDLSWRIGQWPWL